MICALRGKVFTSAPTKLEFEVAGVIYEIHTPLNVGAGIQAQDTTEILLYTHHHITESSQKLFGFLERIQRDFFIALLGVKGIGGSLALSILSHLTLSRLLEICITKDDKSLTHIPKVGKAIAATLMLEVNLKRKKWEALSGDKQQSSRTQISEYPEQELAIQGLVQLGYKEKEAQIALDKISQKSKDPNLLTASEWITACLQIL